MVNLELSPCAPPPPKLGKHACARCRDGSICFHHGLEYGFDVLHLHSQRSRRLL